MAVKKVTKKAPVETTETTETTIEEAKPTIKKEEIDEAFDREFPFGIKDMIEATEADPRNIRRWLRVNEIEKAGKRYGWRTQEEFDTLVEAFNSRPVGHRGRPKAEEKAVEEVTEEVDEAPKPAAKIKRKAKAAA